LVTIDACSGERDAQHAMYNVQTDLGAIAAFGGMFEAIEPDTLLFSVLQT
jgi:hypothetical protein